MAALTRTQRHQLARQATEIRHRCLRDGMEPDAIVEVICRELPQMHALEAWRFAHGWSRTEVSARLDALYEADGLAPPRISSAELCRWEHGQRRPSDERIEYLCRLYATRPDRLGFGVDYSNADVGHLARAGITSLWPRSSPETYADLVERVRNAQEEITVFGLARNFYAKDEILPLFESKAVAIPVTFFVMDPYCDSHGKRGTEGPILVFNEGTPYWDYFSSQIEWMKRLADDPREPWTTKGLLVRPLEERDLSLEERDLAIT